MGKDFPESFLCVKKHMHRALYGCLMHMIGVLGECEERVQSGHAKSQNGRTNRRMPINSPVTFDNRCWERLHGQHCSVYLNSISISPYSQAPMF